MAVAIALLREFLGANTAAERPHAEVTQQVLLHVADLVEAAVTPATCERLVHPTSLLVNF